MLLRCARATLRHFVTTGDRRPIAPEPVTPALMRRGGVFVTLHQRGQLRGCVGNPQGSEPLAAAVAELTLSAALDDPRFSPLTAGDGDGTDIEIEISVLSPLKRIHARESFRLHEHGVHMESGPHRSVFLPQVTRDRGWEAEQFWDALARKSGLTASVYEDPATRLYVFRAQVMSQTTG